VSLRAGDGGLGFADDARLTLRRASTDAPAWDVELLLVGAQSGERGPFSGVIVAEIGHPEVPTLEVPFTGVRP
jgi:hypothetical protein